MVNSLPAGMPLPAANDSLQGRNRAMQPGDPVRMAIVRKHGAALEVTVPYTPRMRVLDALQAVEADGHGDIAFRWLCGSKMCGTCAVRVNGREVLACWEAAEPEMRIEPLRNFPVVEDLVVDRSAYEARIEDLKPWMVRATPYEGFPETLTSRDMRYATEALNCINCAACYSACPVVGLGNLTQFAGPAPLVQFAQSALDPRSDRAAVLPVLHKTGIFDCVSCYKCEEVCPAKIPIVSHVIEPLKRMATADHMQEADHAEAFVRNLRRYGVLNPLALMLQIHGLRILRDWRRGLRLLLRGKLKPWSLLKTGNRQARAAAHRKDTNP